MILGVRTCGGGGGYCLLGTDCTLDRDFAADDVGGHCDGLRFAFTPAAHFSCCKYVERSNTTLPGEPAEATTTEDPALDATTVNSGDNDAENVIETEIRVKPADDTASEASQVDANEDVAPLKGVSDADVPLQVVPLKDVPLKDVPLQFVPLKDVPNADGPLKVVPLKDAPVKNAPLKDVPLKVVPLKDVPLKGAPYDAPLGPASGQTVLAVSPEYTVKGSADEVLEEEAEVVAVAGADKEAVLVSAGCSNSSGEVNPCWRSSFQDRTGATLCSGTLLGVDAAITTAVCANRYELERLITGPGHCLG